ncbi:MAG: hypothetical protein ACLS3C_03620 [Oscillospiraceae bacterium]
MRARLRLLTAGNSYIVPQCGDIVGIHNVDPSQNNIGTVGAVLCGDG